MDEKADKTRLKVARLIEQYELYGTGDELEDRWTRREDRWSLRDLAEYFNRQLIRAALSSEGKHPLDGEIDNLYRLLTDEDVTSGVRKQTRNRLDQQGIDVERIEDDFVTYQSIRTYLKKYHDADPPNVSASPEDRIKRKRSSIQRLTSRLADVTEQSLHELGNVSAIRLGKFDVIVTVRVHCNSCGTQQSVSDLLASQGCECEEPR